MTCILQIAVNPPGRHSTSLETSVYTALQYSVMMMHATYNGVVCTVCHVTQLGLQCNLRDDMQQTHATCVRDIQQLHMYLEWGRKKTAAAAPAGIGMPTVRYTAVRSRSDTWDCVILSACAWKEEPLPSMYWTRRAFHAALHARQQAGWTQLHYKSLNRTSSIGLCLCGSMARWLTCWG